MCKNAAGAFEFDNAQQKAMRRALTLAQQAASNGEVPVGAVVFGGGGVVSEAGNRSIADCDATAHAEIIALREACKKTGNYRLPELSMAVTLEPCAMCVGAILHARLQRVVFGACDEKTGALGGVVNLAEEKRINHQTVFAGGLYEEESAALLRAFFAARR